jgi:hypothetical protein
MQRTNFAPTVTKPTSGLMACPTTLVELLCLSDRLVIHATCIVSECGLCQILTLMKFYCAAYYIVIKLSNTISRRMPNWVGHILCRKFLLNRTIEEKAEGKRRRGRRPKQLLDVLKKMRRYCNLKGKYLVARPG